ncbi:unnamed protein product, partial [Anisakis simplex]|uniref:MATH domain-containing protein n=1 Tax=Anisakis simplex TaxID=6269 RepID=A0A0M3KKM4_ANISI
MSSASASGSGQSSGPNVPPNGGVNGRIRPSDSWSTTEVRSLQHSHVWTIRGFSQCECRYLETCVKIKENSSAAVNVDGGHLTFRIRLHPQGNKESNKDFSFFQVVFLLFCLFLNIIVYVFCNTN